MYTKLLSMNATLMRQMAGHCDGEGRSGGYGHCS